MTDHHRIPYTVFNVEQIDGLPAHFYAMAEATKLEPAQRLEHAEQFFKNTGADIRHGGNRAFYAIGPDYVQMLIQTQCHLGRIGTVEKRVVLLIEPQRVEIRSFMQLVFPAEVNTSVKKCLPVKKLNSI